MVRPSPSSAHVRLSGRRRGEVYRCRQPAVRHCAFQAVTRRIRSGATVKRKEKEKLAGRSFTNRHTYVCVAARQPRNVVHRQRSRRSNQRLRKLERRHTNTEHKEEQAEKGEKYGHKIEGNARRMAASPCPGAHTPRQRHRSTASLARTRLLRAGGSNKRHAAARRRLAC